ncbi:30S ribosomal protein S8 [Candidatus Schneideria nysicola]|uniref:30S ribosomal protein S8 n=1 Tax=Candidatus Schneideria nysicola TaxID=1081631 RepID=UPI001CAA5707|nr:30S ribosomal protein S8 [Candidatus Schneideria nysicola]UAJ64932.1 30S ribosomal protein S8 [Candidatus Schneideria nysicola]UAJ65466.1 30S ribosomal protein S8 [Candidatus Schneideria nysicola]UAJ65995.1 30S ribosomal protein S8 [Candidatus Schneideria nysicola]
MSMQDPIADMLTHIRNSQSAKKYIISIPYSKVKKAIAQVLKEEGFIEDFKIQHGDIKPILELYLKYFRNNPVIENITRISRPGLRIYKKAHLLPKVMGGMGIAIISTSKGIMTDHAARRIGLGGEVLCYVS